MAQAGNYQESDSLLDHDIDRCREDFKVKICRSDGDLESDLHQRLAECKKNPGHVDFIPKPKFTIEHLPVEWRDPCVYKKIREMARLVVNLYVKYTSPDRPIGYIFSEYRGTRLIRCGTGLAVFPPDFRNKPPQQCPFKNCKVSHPHYVTPEFYVDTASHVVFDSIEAEQTEIRFFFDSKDCTKSKADVTAQGLPRMVSSQTGGWCAFACVSHNLNIRDLCISDTEEGELEPTPSSFDTEVKNHQRSFSPMATKTIIKPEPPLRDTNSKIRKPLVVIISHPHGCSKHVTMGYWIGLSSRLPNFYKLENMKCRKRKEMFEKMGIPIVSFDHILYSADTCPGSCGAPVILFYDKDNGELGLEICMHGGATAQGANMSSPASICSLFKKKT